MTSEAYDYPTDRTELVRLEREAYESWWAPRANVPPEATRADGWTFKDVVAHMAAHQRRAATRLARFSRGEPDLEITPTDDFNAAVRAEWLSRPWHEVRAEAHAAHEEFLAALEATPQSALEAGSALGAFVAAANGFQHYAEHAEDFL